MICLDRQFSWHPACAHAQPEQILVSNAIAELCLGKGLQFEDLGEVTLKGFGYPVCAHAAAWKQ
jgi:class 3 adenylate cyclase